MAAVVALVLYLAYLAVCFGLRAWVLYRRTADTGFRGISGRPGSVRWWAGTLFSAAIVIGIIGPIAQLAGLGPVPALTSAVTQWVGGGIAIAGVVLTAITQFAMGDSWRVGVDSNERTALVTTGPFAVVRNPIFSAMLITGLGLALLTPNLVSIAGWIALLIAIQLQVRVVEEPYLLKSHSNLYAAYAARTGRFVPGLGRIRTPTP